MRRWITALVVTFLAVFAHAPVSAAGASMGERVAPFERPDSSGRTVKLTDALRGTKAVVVDFWSARCPVSEKYEPRLKGLATQYGPRGVVFLAVAANYQETAAEIEKVRQQRGVPYPVLLDVTRGELAAYFGASHTPEAYVLTGAGLLVYHGNLDDIGGALDAVLAGKPVPRAETRAFGCGIKRP